MPKFAVSGKVRRGNSFYSGRGADPVAASVNPHGTLLSDRPASSNRGMTHPRVEGLATSLSDETTLVYLRALSAQFPNIDATLAAIAKRRAVLTLPKGTVHVVSDVHGEFKKLIHVINNASGSLRPMVEH